MDIWWILIFIIELSRRATCDYSCTMKSFEVTCSGINTDQLSRKVSVTLNKPDVVSLNITNGIVSTMSETAFQDFTNLESLYVTDCDVSNLEDNAFSHSLDLKHLYINNSSLTKFNVRSLPPENRLNVLDLSYNLLNEFSEFNISYFPKLTFLNIANNFLTYLPINLLTKLEEQNQFYLLAGNNPWNCSDSHWSEYLTDKLINAFCANKTFDYVRKVTSVEFQTTTYYQKGTPSSSATEDYPEISSLPPFVKIDDVRNENDINSNDQSNDQKCEKPNCAKCSFYFCLIWFFCGIWIGIILGNVGKIKDLLCKRPQITSDSYTQCEHSMSDQYMVSGFHLDFNGSRKERRTGAGAQTTNTKAKEKPTPN